MRAAILPASNNAHDARTGVSDMKKTTILGLVIFLAAFAAFGQSVTSPTGTGQAALADTLANPTVPSAQQAQTFPSLFNGSTWDRMRGDATFGQWFNLKAINGVAPSVGHGVPDTGTSRVFIAEKATYSAATTAKTATAAGTGPFLSICGSGTKTIRIQQITIGGTVATAAVYGDVELTKTSTATSSGTATALTKVPNDSASAAATANLLNFYTALATAGTAVGKVGSQTAVFPITGTVAAQAANVIFDWTNRQESEAPVLRGTTQCLEASFGTTTTNAPTLTAQVIWTEE